MNRCPPIGLMLCLCWVGLAGPAWARDVTVAVAGLEGPGKEHARLVGLQQALKRVRGVDIQTTSGFRKEAKKLGVADLLPDDGRALGQVARSLNTDAIIYGRWERPDKRTWSRARKGDRVMILIVYAGANGGIVAERSVRVPKGRLTRQIYRKAVAAIEDDLFKTLDAGAPPPEPEPVPVVPVFEEPIPVTPLADEPVPVEPAPEPAGDGPPVLAVHAGLALLSRTFDYTAAAESAQFAEGGIQYESSTVPGVALDLEVHPLKLATDGFARGFGLGLTFEKVFLSTEQAVQLSDGTTEDASLETTHQHFALRLLYRHVFGDANGPDIHGHVGFGWLSFELEDNPEYNGAAYQYLSLGVGGTVPLGTPLLCLDARVAVLPSVDLGDTAEELGDDVSLFGYRLYGGLASRLDSGLSFQAGVEFTGIDAEVSGEGRDERVGESATDHYLGFRLMGGYRF